MSLPTPYYTDPQIQMFLGDCRAVLAGMDAESLDACVTDPPYELGFMNRGWDRAGVSFQPETWAAVLRVLKPGAHLLAFGGTRTYHRIAVAIEDAGFEIRDTVMWLHAQGFPKSLAVGKAIDKAAGAEREVVGPNEWADRGGLSRLNTYGIPSRPDETAPATPEAQQWDGWGTGLKPSFEPVILARKPLKGNVANNVLAYGTGALNIAASRIETNGERPAGSGNNLGYHGNGRGTGGNQTPPAGRWPANIVFSHHPDCVPVGVKRVRSRNGSDGASTKETNGYDGGWNGSDVYTYTDADGMETVEAWRCVENCPVGILDAQSGERKSGGQRLRHSGLVKHGEVYSGGWGAQDLTQFHPGDSGGASRFFFCAKPSTAERNHGLPPGQRNDHPTVKSVSLMRYLVRLICPPGGTVIDPFYGSGSTGLATRLEGFRCIGIDEHEPYLRIAVQRLAQQVLPLEAIS